ncbi:crotonase/enoyl-CoA hydratase family protein [Ensifer soli]|uniref:crotonase/enoyl-CoA hydratase family protein n=1 Tax=Ciceribacter sp. sgz301302 TaxID=3342379 RepID=UPI0035B87551
MTDAILVERAEALPGVQLIRLNRPQKKNAITRAMYAAMTAALREACDDATVRVTAILGHAGCFSAGNDMADFMAAASHGDLGAEVIEFLRVLARHDKPLVSGVDGLAIGIGATLHLHCDMTIASARSVFRTPFTDLGLVPEAGSSLILPQIAGHQRAFAMLAAGEPFSGREAFDAGIVWRIVEPDGVEEETLALAARLSAKPAEALRLARRLIRGEPQERLARIDAEAAHFAERLRSPEAKAAFAAFLAR